MQTQNPISFPPSFKFPFRIHELDLAAAEGRSRCCGPANTASAARTGMLIENQCKGTISSWFITVIINGLAYGRSYLPVSLPHLKP